MYGDEGHDVDGDPEVPVEEEGEVGTDGGTQAHKLTPTVQEPSA